MKCFFNKYTVNSNDDVITLSVYRSARSIMVEDFFVTIYSEYNFELYNLDDPTNLLPEMDKNKSLFNVFSINDCDEEIVNNNKNEEETSNN